MTEPALALSAASFGYGARAVIEDLSLQVPPGQVVAVLGPNGSGKSTLVKGILGLSEQLAGKFTVYGEEPGTPAARKHIGYVPQRHTLSTSVRATVREVVETGRLAQRPWYRPASPADRCAVDNALSQVGLFDRAASSVADLSGGQQRRVLIARALAGEPDLLIMDEPTAGVDSASQDVLADVLQRLAGQGTTMMIVTHELVALRGIIDRIVEISQGALSFDGTPEAWADQEHERILASASHAGHCPPDEPQERSTYAVGPLDDVGISPRPARHSGGHRA
ncbi:metal ABC transporter ATP-binding protein [Yimella sp. cx-51]|uniref:metal ABC transporter ATP-binding protein n=1 Tax=Yimella sp. cx-51 TaxID=2770551 RepID=UPI00165D7CB1|nr:metal ABC transporter ATP-binding protein [Yimella sp. cx-51]MBC9956920.1 metal ABC transporter ATP-binding protein [Yimella sp. cx-51]QTH39140.1 metal ABC transporter ATP-binding protein [Yimella sp. cx-51]